MARQSAARDRDEARDGPPDVRARPRPAGRGPLITPLRLVVLAALVGSLAYVAYALTVREPSQIPMLASGAAILGIVFLILAIAGGRGLLVAGREARNAEALLLALGGGIAAVIAFGCFAAAIVLALVMQVA